MVEPSEGPASLPSHASPPLPPRRPLMPDELERLARPIAALWRGASPDLDRLPAALEAPGAVYVAARAEGRRVGHAWDCAERATDALGAAVRRAWERTPAAERGQVGVLEVALAHSGRGLDPRADADRIANAYRGLRGLEVTIARASDGAEAEVRVERFAPTEMIATNRSFQLLIERALERGGGPEIERALERGGGPEIERAQERGGGGPNPGDEGGAGRADRGGGDGAGEAEPAARLALRTFEADSLLVRLGAPEGEAVPLFRGNRVVPIEAIDRARVEELARLQSSWLFTNLRPDGRLVYKYWPSAGRESRADNAIRRWMGAIALGRVARRSGDPALLARVEENIRYNLARTYREVPGLPVPPNPGAGVSNDSAPPEGPEVPNGPDGPNEDVLGTIVEEPDKVKLGAVALAALALVEHPNRQIFATHERALRRTVDALWREDGSFQTFLRPAERDDNHNFYPGEALLLWATLHAQQPDARLLARFMKSFRTYGAWHRAQPNPAFVPWHTQAYYALWTATRDPALAGAILAMNDWLLGVQQWDARPRFADTAGRFYDPRRPFGPPHASSTGVYLEGLVDAWRLARALGEEARQERYRRALVRGLRSLAQLTFEDDVDMFYVSRRDPVCGGVRTTVYDNTIRVDNVQHGLLAILKVLEHLPAADLRP